MGVLGAVLKGGLALSPWAAGATATTIGAGRLAGQLPENIREAIGITPEKIAEGETYDLDGNDGKGKFTSGGLDDFVRDVVFGTGDEVRKEAKEQAIDKLEAQGGVDVTRKDYESLGLTAPTGLTYTDGTGTKDYLYDSDEAKKKVAQLKLLSEYGGDVEKGQHMTLPQLMSEVKRTKGLFDETTSLEQEWSPQSVAKREEERLIADIAYKKSEKAKDRQHDEAILDWKQGEAEADRDWRREEGNARRTHEWQQNQAQLAYQDAVDARQNELQLTIANMNREDKRADRRASREDRLAAQRQQSIAQLIKGLTQMGAGMAI